MGRSPCCEKEHTNKGAWTKEEDERLISYIRANGEGSWRSLPKSAGLMRCGKSCRLRWINYLRPDLKRGNFTEEEDELIIKLHSMLGNKWSLIASKLPGRTDNEIKNYWNTHIKRKLISRGIDPQTHLPINNSSPTNPQPSPTTIKDEQEKLRRSSSSTINGYRSSNSTSSSSSSVSASDDLINLELSISPPCSSPSSTTTTSSSEHHHHQWLTLSQLSTTTEIRRRKERVLNYQANNEQVICLCYKLGFQTRSTEAPCSSCKMINGNNGSNIIDDQLEDVLRFYRPLLEDHEEQQQQY